MTSPVQSTAAENPAAIAWVDDVKFKSKRVFLPFFRYF
jgi:hypothetical protein